MCILEIEPLTPPAIPQITALDRLCLGGIWTEEGYRREINSPNSSLLTLNLADSKSSAKKNKIMLGMACLWSIADEAHITLLAVHPHRRRQGLGELLLINLLEDAIARKLAWATLEVNVNNTAAIALYQKFGFQMAGRRKGYYQATGEDAAILWLKGLQLPDVQLSLVQKREKLAIRLGDRGYLWQSENEH